MTKKTRLTKAHRELIQEFGLKHIAATIDRCKEEKQYAILLDGANAAIRAKYPEADMAIIRKYGLERIDNCIRFQFPSGRVDGFSFRRDSGVLDMPRTRGCGYGSSDVFTVTAAVEKAFDEYARMKTENDRLEQQKTQQFLGFLAACQTVDEVMDVVPLPEDIRKRLGHSSTALVAVSPETVESLKATFAVSGKEAA